MRLAMLEVFCVIEIYVRPQIDKPLITVCCLIMVDHISGESTSIAIDLESRLLVLEWFLKT